MVYEWSYRLGSWGRRPWLLLVKGDEVIPFNYQDIEGICVIKGTDSLKDNKWLHNTYRLVLHPEVNPIAGKMGWETNRFVEGLKKAVGHPEPVDTWTDVAAALGVSVPSAMAFLRDWRPKAADALDEVDAALDALEDAVSAEEGEADIRHVDFGGPSRRSRANGFWENPKGIPGCEHAEVYLLDVSEGWYKDNVAIRGVQGTVLDVKRSSGRGGGYVCVTVAIAPDTEEPAEEETSSYQSEESEDVPEGPITLGMLQTKYS